MPVCAAVLADGSEEFLLHDGHHLRAEALGRQSHGPAQQHGGEQAAVIGEVIADSNCFVQMKTIFGGTRIVDWLTGDQLPRIC